MRSWCCLAAAALAGAPNSSAAAGVPDACSLREPLLNICNCLYGDPQAPPDKLEPMPIVSVSVFVGGMEERVPGFPNEAKDTFEMVKKMTVGPRPIPALGDDAYWESSRRELVILRGKYMIAIKLMPDSGDQPAAKALAAKVLERLPR